MPKQLTFYGVLLGILLLSVVVGNSVAEGDYFTPTMMLLAALGVAAIVMPGYGFFLAFVDGHRITDQDSRCLCDPYPRG